MNKGQVERAERKALNRLDEWIDTTGVIGLHSSYHSELEGLIEDAVHIGAQMAIFGNVKMDEDGAIIKERINEQ